MSHPNQSTRKGKEVVNEHVASKRSRASYVSRPLTGFSIHEPLNTPVSSSSDKEDGHIEFRAAHTIQTQFNLTNTVILPGQGSNGSIDARWVTPPEAMWRIFGFTLCENHPSVLQLPLHLPDMQRVTFKEGDNLNDVLASDNASKSMLTEYFVANQTHVWARDILYKDFPGRFTWQRTKYWRRRELGYQVGRIVSANPAEGERYFLRVILNHVPSSVSFEDLRTVEGVFCDTFREAAERRGLIEFVRDIS